MRNGVERGEKTRQKRMICSKNEHERKSQRARAALGLKTAVFRGSQESAGNGILMVMKLNCLDLILSTKRKRKKELLAQMDLGGSQRNIRIDVKFQKS